MLIDIALDALGSDQAPEPEIRGAILACRHLPVRVHLVGPEEDLRGPLQQALRGGKLPIEIVHASERIGMHEKAAQAVRAKKDSSIRVGLKLVREKKVSGFFTAGNTGAAMAPGKLVLGGLTGGDRPALALREPAMTAPTLLLDAGADPNSHTVEWGGDGRQAALFDAQRPLERMALDAREQLLASDDDPRLRTAKQLVAGEGDEIGAAADRVRRRRFVRQAERAQVGAQHALEPRPWPEQAQAAFHFEQDRVVVLQADHRAVAVGPGREQLAQRGVLARIGLERGDIAAADLFTVRSVTGGGLRAAIPADWVYQPGGGDVAFVANDPRIPGHRYLVTQVDAAPGGPGAKALDVAPVRSDPWSTIPCTMVGRCCSSPRPSGARPATSPDLRPRSSGR